ncbi:MAG: hypothetical protein H7Z16_13115 [Pyrinomonadaceae bacterium]|nr:hypothetical protein [Pyrinomonadaceae bacterium]
MVDPPLAARVACAGTGVDCFEFIGFNFIKRGSSRLEIDDDAKEIVRDIGTAINESVENSSKVAEAIERLRDAGYEMELTLRLEIGLRPHAGEDGEERDTTLDLTDEDVEVLQRMKIRIDPEEKD